MGAFPMYIPDNPVKKPDKTEVKDKQEVKDKLEVKDKQIEPTR